MREIALIVISCLAILGFVGSIFNAIYIEKLRKKLDIEDLYGGVKE